MSQKNHYVITIARGFGTGGKMIAEALAQELGIPCYEHRILTFASKLSGEAESKFVEADERLRGGNIAAHFHKIRNNLVPKPIRERFVSDETLFEYQKKIIENLAETESCVIVGKCADHILRGRENVFSFYIEAPRAYCVERIMKRMSVPEAEAHELIASTDHYRAEYYKYYTNGGEWTNPINYDMTLNSERVGFEDCVRIIKEYVQIKINR